MNIEKLVYFDYYDDKDKALADMLPSLSILKCEKEPPMSNETKIYNVHTPDEQYRFLHETAIIEYHGTLFASWYHSPVTELKGRTPVCGRRSKDGGKTWGEIEIIADDSEEKIIYCPPVYGICDDKLYMFINEMTAPDHMHALDLFVFDEHKDRFEKLWSRPIPFKLNTNVVKLSNGKMMLPGRVGELEEYPEIPAVMISDSGKIDAEWRLVKVQEDNKLPDGEVYQFPETSVITIDNKVYMFCRNDKRLVPIIYLSEDNGENWSKPMTIDIPFIHSKICSGTLNDGRNYVIGNIIDKERSKLAVYFSEKGSMCFTSGVLLTNGAMPGFEKATQWHYPLAVETDGELKIICSVSYEDKSRGAALITVPIK